MKSNELRLQLLDYYERNGIDVASMPNGKRWRDRQDCHWPKPECLGGTEMIPLLKDGHILMDLLVSEEVQHTCFYSPHAKVLVEHLPEDLDSEVAAMFVALYAKWSRSCLFINPEDGSAEYLLPEIARERGWVGASKGKAIYRCPDTGDLKALTPEEAEQKGWVHFSKGTAVYKCLQTGQTARLTPEEAEQRGWVGATTGRNAHKDPETGEIASLTPKEAAERGWIGINKGTANYKCPETGEIRQLTPAKAEEMGWLHISKGTAVYTDPATGQHKRMTPEEAEELGWTHSHLGLHACRDPETGKTALLTKEEAAKRGWVSVNKGRVFESSTCPHCGLEGRGSAMNQWHHDNCREREGSWRWFKDQLKMWKQEQKKP